MTGGATQPRRGSIGPSVRDFLFRAERALVTRFGDVEIRQLRSMQRAYNRRGGGPEVLVFGDSSMFWTGRKDQDRAHLSEMISRDLGPGLSLETVVGAGYTSRIILPFISALARCKSRPRAVIVPAAIQMTTSIWQAHPTFGWLDAAAELEAVIEAGDPLPRRLPRASADAEDAYDRLPVPSLNGEKWTIGEVRLITQARPTTPSQKADRLRHLMDYHYAERIEDDGIGLRLLSKLGTELAAMGLPSVIYIQPVNYELLTRVLGPHSREHVERNASLVERTYREVVGDRGTVVNAICDSPEAEFFDPVHLGDDGRLRFANRIADAVRSLLRREVP